MSDEHKDKRRHPRLMREETLSVRPLSADHGAARQDAIYCSTVDMSAAGLQVQLDDAQREGVAFFLDNVVVLHSYFGLAEKVINYPRL